MYGHRIFILSACLLLHIKHSVVILITAPPGYLSDSGHSRHLLFTDCFSMKYKVPDYELKDNVPWAFH